MHFLSALEHGLGLDRRHLVWLLTTIALALPLATLWLLDRLLRKP